MKNIRFVVVLLCMALGWVNVTQAQNKQNKASKDLVITANGVKFTMKYVAGGTFEMGNNDDEYTRPVHKVTLDGYYIGETEVTQALWVAVMGNNPSCFAPKETSVAQCSYDAFIADAQKLNAKKQGTIRIPTRKEWDAVMITTTGSLQNPVEQVRWDDCQEFIRKLNILTGKNFRLPTEAEWEYAARGGKSGGTKYAGSDDLNSVAWHKGNSNGTTHPVKGKKPNGLGLYDMSGNVYEVCSDLWSRGYPSGEQTNPNPQTSNIGHAKQFNMRNNRGGSYEYNFNCEVYERSFITDSGKFPYQGLRLALSE